jgi:ABC-2 type transport system ATP-binding protein
MSALQVSNLVKVYGAVRALDGVTLSVEPGEIFGLIGKNGAGKTTLVKILLSIVHRTAGEARLLGQDVPHAASRNRVGYLPEDLRFPDYHTGESALDFYGSLYGLPGAVRRRRSQELLGQMDLARAARRKIRGYSKGMKQRLGLAQALLHDPDVLFLDEPTDGVDPEGRIQIRDLLLDLRSKGKTIFLNSHLLSEIEHVCTRVGILDQGKLQREGSLDSLRRPTNAYVIRFEGPADGALDEIRSTAPDVRREGESLLFTLQDPRRLDSIIDLLRARGVSVRGMEERKQSLEDIFRETVQKPGSA